MIIPDIDLFNEYKDFQISQGKSPNTIEQYISNLKLIPQNVDRFFSNRSLANRRLKIFAYRSYYEFLYIKKEMISREDYYKMRESIKPIKRRGNHISDRKWSIPNTKWNDYIKQAPNQVAKMGIWIGFNFGLRLDEIIHLRVQDIDFEKGYILIREHKKRKNQESWFPKYNRSRQINILNDKQLNTLKRWITEIRPKDLKHDYVLWTPRSGNIVGDRNFQRYCNKVKLNPHILRYSFATHLYEVSKDISFVSKLLGHSKVSTTSDYLQLGEEETKKKAIKYGNNF